ncbi:MAG: hypothetical protein EOP48_03730 [Sphingobacteriales bacterium]|nr:MAG: hypothetical protein EOP48_03730 [Sphingobacteriales bacterium]
MRKKMSRSSKFSIFGGVILVVAIIALLARKRKAAKKLVIVGNGFDLYHGIPSSYLCFRDYVRKNDLDVYEALEKYLHLDGDNEWNQFEKNMANLDADDLLDEMRIYLGDPEKASSYCDYQYEVGKVTERLGEKMQQLFLSWVLQIDVKHHSDSQRLLLPKDACYLNFNYTNSLERLYGIPAKNILYIHGRAVDENSSIVLGHGWENSEDATNPRTLTYEDIKDGGYGFENDWQYQEAKQSIENYFGNNYKNAKQIIRMNEHYFKSLANTIEIVVMGHSMSGVDLEYFKAVAENIDVKKVKWVISYYRQNDILHCTETLKGIGIDLNLLEFKKLEDIFSIQLDLF